MLQSKDFLISGSLTKSYNMSTDVFIVDTPWLIEKIEEEAKKEYPQKLRYILHDLAVEYNAFAFEYTGYLANTHSVNPTTMQTWICWKPKNS